ncbi:MAG: E3 binding domain-containing protein, partial [Acidimicrobiales bacterium]
MATQIPFPHLSDDSTEGVLVTWFVEEGDEVAEGDLLASVQVEKVEEDMYAPAAGRVAHLLAAPGEVVALGATIAELVGPDDGPTPAPSASAPATEAMPGETSVRPTAAAPAHVAASPAAKRLARELGVDLTTVRGSGPEGRVVEDDVRRASSVPATTPGAAAGTAASSGIPLPGPRRLLAERMQSWKEATAQITLTSEVDVTDLAASDPPWAAALVRASALVLPRHPLLTRRWDGDLLVPAAS